MIAAVQIALRGKRGAGRVARVDAHLAPTVMRHKWSVTNSGYPRAAHVGYLHHFVLRLAGIAVAAQADHQNRDPLDCRLENLRPATQSLNNRNQVKRRGATSRYRGVSRYAHGGWQAQIRINGTQTPLGVYDSEEEAALVYNRAACALPEREFFALNPIADDGRPIHRRVRVYRRGGVHRRPESGRWQAMYGRQYLGRYANEAEAWAVVERARRATA